MVDAGAMLADDDVGIIDYFDRFDRFGTRRPNSEETGKIRFFSLVKTYRVGCEFVSSSTDRTELCSVTASGRSTKECCMCFLWTRSCV